MEKTAIEFETYINKRVTHRAILVTAENMRDVAEAIGGQYCDPADVPDDYAWCVVEDQEPFIKVRQSQWADECIEAGEYAVQSGDGKWGSLSAMAHDRKYDKADTEP